MSYCHTLNFINKMAILNCCSDFQTECLKVVNIGYLKAFVGSFVQDTNGSPITIIGDDNYCPTYKELTNGTFIQSWQQGTTPRSDRDGIVVSPTCVNNGLAYAQNQNVDQRDLSLRYTRFNSLSVTNNYSGLSECGESKPLATTYNYTRTNKYMNASCVTASSSVTENSNCAELAWHTTYGTADCSNYTIGKNGTVSAASRADSVYSDVTFRGTSYSSNTLSMQQDALSGDYSVLDSYSFVTTGASVVLLTESAFTSCGEVQYGAKMMLDKKKVETRRWKDSCGEEYPDIKKEFESGESETVEYSSVTKTWAAVPCPTESQINRDTIEFTYEENGHVFSGSASFERRCSQTCCEEMEYDVVSGLPSTVSGVSNCGSADTLPFAMEYRCKNPREESGHPFTDYAIEWSYVRGDKMATFNGLDYTVKENCTNDAREGTYKATIYVGGIDEPLFRETYEVTFKQDAGPCADCECSCDMLDIELLT